jgi:hypothetical protein
MMTDPYLNQAFDLSEHNTKREKHATYKLVFAFALVKRTTESHYDRSGRIDITTPSRSDRS